MASYLDQHPKLKDLLGKFAKELVDSGQLPHTQEAVAITAAMVSQQLRQALRAKETELGVKDEEALTEDSRAAETATLGLDGQSASKSGRKRSHSKTEIDKIVSDLFESMTDTREIYNFTGKTRNGPHGADAASESIRAWRTRPLQAVYPTVFFDTFLLKMHRNGAIRPTAVHLAIGVDTKGHREVLGYWFADNDGADFWQTVFSEWRRRGVEDVLLMVGGDLPELAQAFTHAFPKATHQASILQLARNSATFVVYKDRKAVCDELKNIYTADNAEEAERRLEAFEASELGLAYPRIGRVWRNAWERIVPFFGLPPAVRKMLYATNAFESLHRGIRKSVEGHRAFESEDAADRCIGPAIISMADKRQRSITGWRSVKEALLEQYGDRLSKYVSPKVSRHK